MKVARCLGEPRARIWAASEVLPRRQEMSAGVAGGLLHGGGRCRAGQAMRHSRVLMAERRGVGVPLLA